MPTDATGAPTSLGIRKYNTSADAPSGLGFNGAMDDIDVLLAARITKPATPGTNAGLIWSGAAWVAGPKTTTSTMAGGPPGAPVTGDIWIATAVDAAGTAWMFQYDSTQATYKWVFIGGAPARNLVDTAENITTLNAWVDLATVGPKIVVARGGDYHVEVGVTTNDAGAVVNTFLLDLAIGAGGVIGNFVPARTGTTSTQVVGLGYTDLLTSLAAASEIRLKYQVSTGGSTGAQFQHRWMRVLPVRVI